MTTRHQQIPASLRIVISTYFLLFAFLAALHGVGGSSIMAWVAFLLFLALGTGFAFGKNLAPSLASKSKYKLNLIAMLVFTGLVIWLIVRKLGA